ncbi:MAG TPA: glycosyltransferase [Chloroflexota bacterium]|nr:glycosyltransferase [Chloroflexota bacterium]
MRCSIVIRAKNEGRFIGHTLEAIARQEFDGGVEVVVVDSGSTDGTVEIVKSFPTTLLQIPAESFTYGRALNIGIQAARGKYVASLSAHSLPIGATWLSDLLEPFSDHNVCGVYGRQLPRANASHLEVFGMWYTGITSTRRRVQRSNPMFSNANGAIRRDLWESEHFDENVAGAEDLVWVRLMLRRGYSVVFEPSACAFHSHGVPLHRHLRQILRDLPTVASSMLSMSDRRRTSRGPA